MGLVVLLTLREYAMVSADTNGKLTWLDGTEGTPCCGVGSTYLIPFHRTPANLM